MRYSVFSMFLVLLVACSEEQDFITIWEEPFEIISNVEIASLTIAVGEDIPFQCTIENQTYSSTSGEYLLLENLVLNKKGAVVLIEAEGRFDEVRYVVPSLDARLHVQVKLTRHADLTEINFPLDGFNAALGGVIDMIRLDIEIDPNSIVDSEGELYTGDVQVFGMKLSNAAYFTHIWSFPQVLMFQDNKSRILSMLDGVNLAMYDMEMNRVHLKEGKQVSIVTKPLESESNPAPDRLEMVYFDKTSNEWVVENNFLEKDGEEWRGKSSKLELNCWGELFDSKVVEIPILTIKDVPVSNCFVSIFTDLEVQASIGFSDQKGIFRSHVPINKDFQTSIIEIPNRENLIRRKAYSGVMSNAVEPIQLDEQIVDPDYYDTFEGVPLNCFGNTLDTENVLLTEGYEFFASSKFKQLIFPNENGRYEFATQRNKLDKRFIQIVELDGGGLSPKFEFDMEDTPIIDWGVFSICNEYDFFMNYNLIERETAFDAESNVQTEFVNPFFESIFEASAVNSVGSEDRTVIRVQHDSELETNIDYSITEFRIQNDNGESPLTFTCNGGCFYALRINVMTPEYYEGLIMTKNFSNLEEGVVGVFRVKR